MKSKVRLINQVSIEAEWQYLINETLIGEICILPLLDELSNNLNLPSGLRNILIRQIDEEYDHVIRYRKILNGHEYSGSKYDIEFSEFVRDIKPITLKLFALQALLESISLGALTYRLENFLESPSKVDDLEILKDEEGHVRFGLAFLGQLKELDGAIEFGEFDKLTHRANSIFSRHFNGNAISQLMQDHYGIKHLSSTEIDSSEGMKVFRRTSTRKIVSIKNEFIKKYLKTSSEQS